MLTVGFVGIAFQDFGVKGKDRHNGQTLVRMMSMQTNDAQLLQIQHQGTIQ